MGFTSDGEQWFGKELGHAGRLAPEGIDLNPIPTENGSRRQVTWPDERFGGHKDPTRTSTEGLKRGYTERMSVEVPARRRGRQFLGLAKNKT